MEVTELSSVSLEDDMDDDDDEEESAFFKSPGFSFLETSL